MTLRVAPGAVSAREACLEAARQAVVDRAGAYGPPVPFFTAVARRWSLTLGVEISARQVVLALLDFKLQRALAGGAPDTPIDLAGYSACLAEIDAFFAAQACTAQSAAE